jgi:hypothetical protein
MEQRYFMTYLNGYDPFVDFGWFDTEEDVLDFIITEGIDRNNIKDIFFIPYVEDIKSNILGK